MMKHFAVRVGLCWVVYEVVRYFLGGLFASILGSAFATFYVPDATDPESMERFIALMDISSTVAMFMVSFLAFFSVCYFFFAKKESSDVSN